MGRGELVALLDAAPGALRTLRGTVRRWTHVGRGRTASERANDRGGEPAELLIAWDGSGGMPPETTESESHVWYAAPNRWRVEGDDTTLYLSDGDQRWEGFTSFVTERGGPGEVPGLADSPPLADWLLPEALLGAYRFDEVTEVEAFGRRARPCRLWPRRGPACSATPGPTPLASIWRRTPPCREQWPGLAGSLRPAACHWPSAPATSCRGPAARRRDRGRGRHPRRVP